MNHPGLSGSKVKTHFTTVMTAPSSASDLVSLFECPVCFEFVLPPILQCQNGHLVCSTCRQKITCCPTCRAPIEIIRNLTLEKVASNIFYVDHR
ncbi:E3 ubiquitin-protein ligase Siah1-like isoform X2 [Limulus polyphemus]|uniref:E3 ubiquitin-protein ligase Siah1-like isoform X2 n=1 Tax=Limulus polyphemus TaxID=6850 RepID=A0ABM1TME7_LIMPO|nr:E3 ubiquitin-protein ligase Siah1-like isoform X2 [Limulus polyphemus]